jgi:hypothetical protein
MGYRETYLSSAAAYAALLERIPVGRWAGPGLGEWTLRDLVGHTVGAGLSEVRSVLASTADRVDIDSPEGYYALAGTVAPEVYAAAVAASTDAARRDGESLGDEPGVAVRSLIAEVTALLADVADDDVVVTAGGGMRVAAWLPTRILELTVHGHDTAAAAGVAFSPDVEAVAAAAALAARIGVAMGEGDTVLRALTGRAVLPAGFSVL